MKYGRGLLLALAAAAVLSYLYLNNMLSSDANTADSLPPDPAGRRAAVLQALANEGITGKQANILLGQGILETGNFTSQAFNASLSIWNRHVGSGGYGDWNGKVYMDGQVYDSDTEALKVDPANDSEHLRCFDSLEQCVRDMKGLLQLSLYAKAKQALDAGDGQAYAAAIAYGDGKNGFVGPTGTSKASNYTAGLVREFQGLGVA